MSCLVLKLRTRSNAAALLPTCLLTSLPFEIVGWKRGAASDRGLSADLVASLGVRAPSKRKTPDRVVTPAGTSRGGDVDGGGTADGGDAWGSLLSTRALEVLRHLHRGNSLPTDPSIYTRCMSELVRHGLPADALKLFAEMRHRHLGLHHQVTYNIAINACEKARDWQAALGWLRCMHLDGNVRHVTLLPDSESYKSAIVACADTIEVGVALELVDEAVQQELSLDAVTFSCVADACRRAHRWDEAGRMLALLRERGLPRTLAILAGATDGCWRGQFALRVVDYATSAMTRLSQRHFWAEALVIFDRLQHRQRGPGEQSSIVDVVAYNAALAACQRGQSSRSALGLLDAWKRRAPGTPSQDPDLVSYNTTIGSCKTEAAWVSALGLLTELVRLRLTPDAMTLGNTIASCTHGHAWENAYAVFTMAFETRLKVDVATFNATIPACGRGGNTGSARILIAKMGYLGLKPDRVTFASAMTACQWAAQWSDAVALLERMESQTLQVDIFACNALIAACRDERWEVALEVFRSLVSRELEPSAASYTLAIGACDRGHHLPLAMILLREMQWHKVRTGIIHYNAALGACAAASEWGESLALLEEARLLWLSPDEVTYCLVIGACENVGKWEQALAVLEAAQVHAETLRHSPQPSHLSSQVYSAAISALEKGAEWQRAMCLLRRMHTLLARPTAVSHQAAILAAVAAGQDKVAQRLFEEAEAVGIRFGALREGVAAEGEHLARSPELDLHGLPVEIARLVVLSAAAKLVSQAATAEETTGDLVLTVITGRGRRSPGGNAALRNMVLESFFQNPQLEANVDAANPGCVVLSRRLPPT